MILGQEEKASTAPLVDAAAAPPSCDCSHETLTDGLHHYLYLPGDESEPGIPKAIDETLEKTEGFYIAIAAPQATYCFMRPTWAASFSGPSEAGEIPTSLRLLCDWCKNHWKNAPQVTFRAL